VKRVVRAFLPNHDGFEVARRLDAPTLPRETQEKRGEGAAATP
jgi:hypothetical protein